VSALLLLVLLQFPLDVFENSGSFTKLDESDGVTMSGRQVKSSPYQEYRAEVSSPHPVEAFCVAIYEWGSRDGDGPGVLLHQLLKDSEDRRVIYNQIAQPMISKRDFAMTMVRERLPDGNCRIRFRATNDEAPPKPEGFVRMDKMWGEWKLEAAPTGGSKVTYTLFSDPGGAIPSFLVHGAQKKATRDALLLGLKKTKQHLEGGKK
jgi:hypothetical protein